MSRQVSMVHLNRGGLHTTADGPLLSVYMDDLVAFYPMEDKEIDVMYDESKNGHQGTVYGASQTEGVAGQALEFSDNDYVEVPDVVSLDFGRDDFSYCFFFSPGEDGKILHKRDEKSGFETRIVDGKIRTILEDPTGSAELVSNTRTQPDEQYFVAIVREESVAQLSINDNKEDITKAEFDLDNSSPLRISDETSFQGIIDEVYLYKRGLTDQELTNIYEKYIGP